MEVLNVSDIEFMLDCCMNSVFKIFGIKEESRHDELSKFVLDNFSSDVNIDCKKLTRWCCKSKTITSFFKVIKKEIPKLKRSLQNPKMSIVPEIREISCFEYLETASLDLKKKKAKAADAL